MVEQLDNMQRALGSILCTEKNVSMDKIDANG